jgi:hypothetical protein
MKIEMIPQQRTARMALFDEEKASGNSGLQMQSLRTVLLACILTVLVFPATHLTVMTPHTGYRSGRVLTRRFPRSILEMFSGHEVTAGLHG